MNDLSPLDIPSLFAQLPVQDLWTDLWPELNAGSAPLSPPTPPREETASDEGTLGVYLKKLRLRKELTQQDLEALSKVDFRTISSLETDRRRISESQATRLAKCLGVTAQDLLSKPTPIQDGDENVSPLRKYREQKRISQVTLSKEAGVGFRVISRFELKKQELRYDQAQRIAKALTMPLEMLLSSEALLLGNRLANATKGPFSLHLSQQRLAKNLQVHELATRARLNSKTIKDYESGSRPPKLRLLKRIAQALELSFEQLCS